MIWSTYFGGSDFETGNSLQLSSNGKLYIAGGTSSTDLPISIGENLTYNGGISDGYILKLNCDKALALLKWTAVMGFEDTVQLTSEWYKSYYSKPEDIKKKTFHQIEQYQEIARIKGIDWAQ